MEPYKKVLEAWNNAGPRPDFHRHMQTRLHQEWPTLARALEELAENNS